MDMKWGFPTMSYLFTDVKGPGWGTPPIKELFPKEFVDVVPKLNMVFRSFVKGIRT